MDALKLAKNCGCVRKVCNNRGSSLQWCTNYSCSYNRSSTFGTWKKKKTAEVPNKPLIEQQRDAQRLVMENLKNRWDGKGGVKDDACDFYQSSTLLQQSSHECFLPSNISTHTIPHPSNPFDYMGKKRKVRPPCATNVREKPEPEGFETSVAVTTSSLGYRPVRRHFKNRRTFLWV